MADDENLTPSGSNDSNEAEAKSAADVQTESSAEADAQAELKSETETDVGGNEVQAASHINASDSRASESIREEMSIDKDKLSSVSTNDSKLIDAQSLHERAKKGSNDEDQERYSLDGGDKELKEEAPDSPEASTEPKSTAAPPDVDNIRHALEGFRQERRRSSMSVISDTPLVENSAPRHTSFRAERKAEMNRFTALQLSFYDVVETEAEPQASNTDFSERLAGRITESSWFQNFILSCIIFNTILSILYTEPDIEKNFGSLIDQADSVFLTIYLMEIWLKMIYQKGSFWLDNWNIFDFSLIFVSVLSTFVRDIGTGSSIDGRVLRFLRVLRAFRTLRILGALRKLQVVVNTFLKSLMELTNIVVMILLLIFMFAIMGLQLFQQYSPEYFGTLTQSAMTLFICITQEGWVEITDEVFESVANSDDGVDHFMSAAMHAFFIIYITIGAWTMINLISGITVTNWQLYVDEMKAMERARYHEIEMPSLRDDQVAKDTRPVSAKTVKPEVWGKQIPLASASSIGRISVQKLENYMLVLDALEKNMQEYMNLKKKLREHLDVIKSTNSILDVSLLDRESSDTRFDGDVLSIQMMQSKTPQDDDVDMQRTRNAGRRSSARRSSAILPRPFMN
ncbi:Sodium channel protein type 11 subunit alpha [Hondaea fermentalgiana]|uniref:Sodium channel protein type 11 subunit alpha n=1 Tax=Hondaea fermentalgiana TaxID=2315210 RepID=A0A2R5GZJ4_9STRA|nr:Sodium channel protein type 11 subunit alpha [Hondaea fermentalgiana]|eukprot:GBG33901.1 Sodium channel protein type 11 subunit alpha [Hondaea fermentalgiana]